jgi:acrylyl-CoA reductase (NADPH)
MASRARREAAWSRLARDLDAAAIASLCKIVGLAEALGAAQDIVSGKIRGRVVVDVNR